jgi:hypothetical protein
LIGNASVAIALFAQQQPASGIGGSGTISSDAMKHDVKPNRPTA